VEEGNKHEFITAFHDCVSSSSSSSSVHDELNRLQEAVSNCELGITGPLFGDKKDVIAAEDALEREWQLLDMLGLLDNEEETEEGESSSFEDKYARDWSQSPSSLPSPPLSLLCPFSLLFSWACAWVATR